MHYLEEELYSRVQNDPSIFEFLQNGSLDGLWYWDLENPDHEWMSPRFWRVLGFDPNEKKHLANEWQNLIFKEDLEEAKNLIKKHLENPQIPYDLIVRYKHCNGSTVWVRCRGIAIRNKEGKAIRMLGAHTDITALKKSNEELKQFVHVASHDLIEPLRVITSFTKLLDQQDLDEESQIYLEFIQESCERMRGLLAGILQLSRIETNGHTFSNIYLDDVLHISLNSLKEYVELSKAQIKFTVLPKIYGNTYLLSQVFTNIIGNAIKFSGESSPVISIRHETQGDYVVVHIEDRGIGFNLSQKDKIFNMFFRGHTKQTGSGIGLAVCKGIIDHHGGHISANSESGITTFTFTIPLAKD